MMARIRKSMNEKDQGFTLIELLVVMIIIGILAAIAIPVFLNQRKKAVDTAARADVSTLGKEIATYYVDATTALVAGDVTGPASTSTTVGNYAIKGVNVGNASKGVGTPVLVPGTPTTTAPAETIWCVQVSITGGSIPAVSYSAAGGLENAAC